MRDLKNNKGITMISLVITIIVLMIVTSITIYNGTVQLGIKKIDNLYVDIDSISTKVAEYYLKNEALPIFSNKYVTNKDALEAIFTANGATTNITNVNDGNDYYVIDLSKLDNLTLNYGDDYKNWTSSSTSANIQNVYIINTVTHQIYFPQGIHLKDEYYFTRNPDENIITPIAFEEIEDDLSIEITNISGNDIDYENITITANISVSGDLSNYNINSFEYAWAETQYEPNNENISYTKFKLDTTNENTATLSSKSLNNTAGYYYLYIKAMDTNGEYKYARMRKLAAPITGWNGVKHVNAPKLSAGMIPIKYSDNKWVICSEDDLDWYDYDNKQWANICTVDNVHSSYRTASVGTEIPVEDMTTMFVWVPRYAYSIKDGYQTANTETPSATNSNSNKRIDVKFLVKTTNRDKDNTTYKTDYDARTEVQNGITPMIVHPGFRIGNRELPGIWMAKFDASGTTTALVDGETKTVPVGNGTSSSNAQQYAPDSDGTTTFVKFLPGVISWRYITIGESQYQCMQMSSNTNAYGWSSVNTHLIRNSEWGAVAYLCYSKYGAVPMENGAVKQGSGSWYYDYYTGAGPKTDTTEQKYDDYTNEQHGYNTENGQLASTTGNVYGVYDMSGGAWNRVSAYLDNGNGNLNTYGKNKAGTVKYFENGKLNSNYSSLWEGYEVGEEEKNNSIAIEGEGNLDQTQLWNKSGNSYTDTTVNIKYNTARKRITDSTYNLLAKVKGIGANEVAGSHSYYGVKANGSYEWLIKADDSAVNHGKTWNRDVVCVGHSKHVFVVRGGGPYSNTNAGVFYLNSQTGSATHNGGFRAVLCP